MTASQAASNPIGARVKFRDDHPEYPGMVGTVDALLTLPGGEPTVSVLLDAVPATADEIEPFIEDPSSYLTNVVNAEHHLTENDQDAILRLLSGPEKVHLYDRGWYESLPLWRPGSPGAERQVTALFYADGTIRVRHNCKVVDGQQLVVAPALQLDGGHRVVQERPLTVEPSVLCPDCGLHGFIRQAAWVAA